MSKNKDSSSFIKKKLVNKTNREHWKSRIGFIWAAVGSAVGLGSIWRFPYVVGENGGASFIALYLICLIFVGFPVLISEVVIGRKAQLGPAGAFSKLGRSPLWGRCGALTVITGFLVSAFYAVVASWVLGYFVRACLGQLTSFAAFQEAKDDFTYFSASPYYSFFCLFGFLCLSVLVLYTGLRKGVELGNKIMMPLLLIVLFILVCKGVMMPGGGRGITFLFAPNWAQVTPGAILTALGQAFFSLSLGQGTMTTYGSYISKKDNLSITCGSIALFGMSVALLAGVAIFTTLFAYGVPPTAGQSLIFQTLPVIFSTLSGGYFFCILFFLLLLLAGLTSQISAMEPLIAYLIDMKKWGRRRAVLTTSSGVFVLAIPCAFSFGLFAQFTLFGKNFFDFLLFVCLNILIPLGGLLSVILLGWRWGIGKAINHLKEGAGPFFTRFAFFERYLCLSIKYLAPLLILVIMLDALGFF